MSEAGLRRRPANGYRDPHPRASRIIEFMNCWSQMTYIQCNEVEEQLLQIKVDWPVRLANGYRDPHPMASRIIDFMNFWSWQMIYIQCNAITTSASSTGSMPVVADGLLGKCHG